MSGYGTLASCFYMGYADAFCQLQECSVTKIVISYKIVVCLHI